MINYIEFSENRKFNKNNVVTVLRFVRGKMTHTPQENEKGAEG